MLKSTLLLLLNLSLIKCRKGKFEGFIVQGQDADIRMFPYSTLLYISDQEGEWICGGSLVNQDIVLTAAHCLYGVRPHHVLVKYGHANRRRGYNAKPFEIILHNLYDDDEVEWDIGIMKLMFPVTFDVNVGRVAIMPYPPHGMATIAGWGNLHDINKDDGTHDLQHTQQRVSNRTVCMEMIGYVPIGTICGGYFNEKSYPSRGDSGSALVVRSYIQVGLVSFKRMEMSRSIIVYTDIGYYYNWISRNAYYLCVLKKEADAKNQQKKKPTTPAPKSTEEDFFDEIFPVYG